MNALLPFRKILLFTAVCFALTIAAIGIKYLRDKDAVDLCNRITGSRLLASKIEPYHYFWKKGDPDFFYNPYETIRGKINSITAPPSVLLMMQPFVAMNFTQAKWCWLLFSYLLISASIFLMVQWIPKQEKILAWTFAVFFFMASMGWLLHVERGQIYGYYLFLLCGSYYFFRKENFFWSLGFLMVLIWLRLPFIVFLLPFASYYKKKTLWFSALFWVLLLAGVTAWGTDFTDWKGYSEAMSEWGKAQITRADIFADPQSQVWQKYLVGKEEGRDYLISNSSLQYLAQYHAKISLAPILLMSFFVAAAVIVLFLGRKYFSGAKKEMIFLISFLLYILLECCLPAPRFNYTYIQWVFPFLLLWPFRDQVGLRKEFYFFCLLGLAMNLGLFFFIPRSMVLGEGMIFLSFIFGCKKVMNVEL
ncbi:MAG TPA: glycosyltransferase family 87 protein [Cytophagaceae bacterium]|nr:glycosyltransferase family 87 protein [Cytophagaceae bacterium]